MRKLTRAGCDAPVTLLSSYHAGDTYSKIPECARSCHSGSDNPTSCAPIPGRSSTILTNCSGCGYGSGCSRVASITEKIAVVAPTPNAIVEIATRVNPGDLRNIRKLNRTS